MRRMLLLLGVLFFLPVFALADTTTPSGVVNYITVNPVTVQAIGIDTASPLVGQTVTAGAKLVAANPTDFDRVVIAVRDSSDANHDFPSVAPWSLGTTQKELKSARGFAKAGTYTMWVAYYSGGRWTNLSPRRTFTVQPVSPVPSPTPSPTPSATPSPTRTPTASPSSTPTPSASSSPTPTSSTPMPKGPTGSWTLKFGDEFNGSSVDWTKWSATSLAESDGGHGNPGNQQLEWNQAANLSVSNGALTITAKPDSITSPYTGRHYNWSSGLLSSEKSFSFQYGYIEERAQLPAAKGFWPAFWTFQAPGVDRWIETDVYEYYSDNPTRLYLSQHSGTGGSYVYTPPFNPASGFHTYGADVKPSGTDFYIDGIRVYSTPATSTGLTNVLTDLFVYSEIPPDPGVTATKKVDYIRVWQR
jgi:Glycosyl hydrolases family 16